MVTMYNIRGGKLEAIKEIGSLPLNSRVYSFGGGMSCDIWAVIDDKNNLVKISENREGAYFSRPYHQATQRTNPLSKKFGIGFYWDDLRPGFRFTDDEVLEAKIKADFFIKEQAQKRSDKADADKKDLAELPARYPHLKPLTESSTDKDAKANLVAHLKFLFPGTKFSVRKAHWGTYNISWTNGAPLNAVGKIGDMFEDYETDETGDYRDPAPSNFNKIFGGFKYVFTNRDYCDKVSALFMKDSHCNQDAQYHNRALREALNKTDIPANFESVSFNLDTIKFEGIN